MSVYRDFDPYEERLDAELAAIDAKPNVERIAPPEKAWGADLRQAARLTLWHGLPFAVFVLIGWGSFTSAVLVLATFFALRLAWVRSVRSSRRREADEIAEREADEEG
jgi:hypothetical protein